MLAPDALYGSLYVLIGRLHAITSALVEKGIVSEADINAKYPKSQAEMKSLYDYYVAPFLGPLELGE